jgi:hypothetical protein
MATDDLVTMAETNEKFAEDARNTHYNRADLNALLHRLVGGAAVVTSAVVSTSILASLNKDHPSFGLTLAAGILAVVAAVLSGLQTFYKFGEVGERHRLAGAYFGELRRDLELLRRCPTEADRCTELRKLLDRLGKLEEAGPGYPASVFHHISEPRRGWRFWQRPETNHSAKREGGSPEAGK